MSERAPSISMKIGPTLAPARSGGEIRMSIPPVNEGGLVMGAFRPAPISAETQRPLTASVLSLPDFKPPMLEPMGTPVDLRKKVSFEKKPRIEPIQSSRLHAAIDAGSQRRFAPFLVKPPEVTDFKPEYTPDPSKWAPFPEVTSHEATKEPVVTHSITEQPKVSLERPAGWKREKIQSKNLTETRIELLQQELDTLQAEPVAVQTDTSIVAKPVQIEQRVTVQPRTTEQDIQPIAAQATLPDAREPQVENKTVTMQQIVLGSEVKPSEGGFRCGTIILFMHGGLRKGDIALRQEMNKVMRVFGVKSAYAEETEKPERKIFVKDTRAEVGRYMKILGTLSKRFFFGAEVVDGKDIAEELAGSTSHSVISGAVWKLGLGEDATWRELLASIGKMGPMSMARAFSVMLGENNNHHPLDLIPKPKSSSEQQVPMGWIAKLVGLVSDEATVQL